MLNALGLIVPYLVESSWKGSFESTSRISFDLSCPVAAVLSLERKEGRNAHSFWSQHCFFVRCAQRGVPFYLESIDVERPWALCSLLGWIELKGLLWEHILNKSCRFLPSFPWSILHSFQPCLPFFCIGNISSSRTTVSSFLCFVVCVVYLVLFFFKCVGHVVQNIFSFRFIFGALVVWFRFPFAYSCTLTP